MPLKRKYKSRSRSRSGKYRRGRRTYQKMKKAATAVLNKKIETKHASFGNEDVSLYHNHQIGALNTQPLSDIVFFNCWTKILTGTGVVNRIGNEIMPRGLSLRMYIENDDVRPNLHYRILIGMAPKLDIAGVATTYNNLEPMDVGGSGSNIIRHINTDAGYKILYDRIHKNEIGVSTVSGVSTKRYHFFKKIWLKAKKGIKIVYNNSVTGVISDIINKRMFLSVIAYDSYNTPYSDYVAKLSYQCKMYWKDA